jgi:hypothetical protein
MANIFQDRFYELSLLPKRELPVSSECVGSKGVKRNKVYIVYILAYQAASQAVSGSKNKYAGEKVRCLETE